MVKHINKSDSVKNIKLSNGWNSVNPGEVIELPFDMSERDPEWEVVKEKPVKKKGKKKGKDKLDLNNDGKVDKKDFNLAGKVLREARKAKKSKKKK